MSVNATGLPYVANISLTAGNYDSVTGFWTAGWDIPWNATIQPYNFTFYVSWVIDKYGNYLSADKTSPGFDVAKSVLTVSAIYTDRTTYERGYRVLIYFTATYPDGTLVEHGNATIKITDPLNITHTANATYDGTDKRFEATYDIDIYAPYGTWTVTLEAYALSDWDSKYQTDPNTGPAQPVSTYFSVTRIVELHVVADVGSIYFRGEIAEFYIQTSALGELIDIDKFDVLKLYKPDGTAIPLTATRIDVGTYKATYQIKADDPVGVYALSIQVSKLTAELKAHGATLKAFGVSSTLTGWNASIAKIEGDIATIVIPQLGEIKVNLTSIYAKLVDIDGAIATINTTLGSIQTDVENINAKLQSINGTIATISSDIGEIKVSISNINAKLISIDNGIATINTTLGMIQTDINNIKTVLVSVDGRLATINSTLGVIQTDISNINAKLISLNGTVATIESSVGTIKVNINKINATITKIDGNIATISTTLGDVKGTVTDVKDKVYTIETDLGTVKVDVSDVKGTAEGIATWVYVTLAFALLAFIAAVGAIIFLRRKVA